jgi:valyl-tRNA synthetase
MSKSLGTGIDPVNLCEKYGADATRFGISWQLMGGQDIHFVEDNIAMGRKFCNKIWNASRFVLMQEGKSKSKLDGKKPKLTKKSTPADKKILKALDKTIKSVDKYLENFQFGQAARQLYSFFWHDFCDLYIEKAKKTAAHTRQENKKTEQILLYVLLSSLKLLHPFIPFVTEEIYQGLPMKNKKKCLIIEDWPK